jgi:FMN-dependent NADH-azoreductase
MKNTLLITSSPRGEASYSTKIASEVAHDLGGSLTTRELWRNPLAPIGEPFIAAAYAPKDLRTPEQAEALATSAELIAELFAADTIVIGAGLINFGMPIELKTWIDHITRKDETFRYGESGFEGLLTGKRAILVVASGGVYSSGPMASFDHLEPALRSILEFLGIADITTIRIEGVAFGPEATEKALAGARASAKELLPAKSLSSDLQRA